VHYIGLIRSELELSEQAALIAQSQVCMWGITQPYTTNISLSALLCFSSLHICPATNSTNTRLPPPRSALDLHNNNRLSSARTIKTSLFPSLLSLTHLTWGQVYLCVNSGFIIFKRQSACDCENVIYAVYSKIYVLRIWVFSCFYFTWIFHDEKHAQWGGLYLQKVFKVYR